MTAQQTCDDPIASVTGGEAITPGGRAYAKEVFYEAKRLSWENETITQKNEGERDG
ncbi:hypothetical protein [Vallitalea sediminicola]